MSDTRERELLGGATTESLRQFPTAFPAERLAVVSGDASFRRYFRLALSPTGAQPEGDSAQPTALIIGNSNYSNFSNLPDAAADATMLAETLGFTSFPLVSRRLVSIDGVCIVEPEPVDDCD